MQRRFPLLFRPVRLFRLRPGSGPLARLPGFPLRDGSLRRGFRFDVAARLLLPQLFRLPAEHFLLHRRTLLLDLLDGGNFRGSRHRRLQIDGFEAHGEHPPFTEIRSLATVSATEAKPLRRPVRGASPLTEPIRKPPAAALCVPHGKRIPPSGPAARFGHTYGTGTISPSIKRNDTRWTVSLIKRVYRPMTILVPPYME